ncbi:MAG: FHA domain-containing protein [Acidobacteria bacterium]|nr:FHA domain-containing protein [Acidobacteriota bacterium]
MKVIFKPLSASIRESFHFDFTEENRRLTVGRKPDNDLSIPLPNVSSYHAVIEFQNGVIAIEDLNSTNGVFVNGKKLTERVPVECGDRIAFGSIDFLLECESEASETPSPAQIQEEEPENGTVMVDVTEIPDIPLVAPVSEEGKTSGAERNPAKKTVLFGMKNVLMSPRLVLLDDNLNPTEEFVLDKGEMIVGREADSDIQIDHVSISRIHARLIRKGDNSFSVEDENSTNGLFIKDKRVSEHALRHGDLLRFGDVSAVYLAPGKLFSFEDLKEGKGSAGSPDNKKKLLIVVGGVLLFLLIILMLLPSGGSGGVPGQKGNRLTRAEIMKEVHLSMENQDWDKVVELIQSFQLKGADSELEKAKMEIANRSKFLAMNQKIQSGDFSAARDLLSRIDPKSVYLTKGNEVLKSAESSYIDNEGEKIEGKLGDGDLESAYELAALLKEKFPDNQDVQEQYSDVAEKYNKFKKRVAARTAYVKRQRAANRKAAISLKKAREYYLNGRIVDALASITQASNAYLEKNLKIPSRIRHLKKYMNEVRRNYEQGKQLALQGKVSKAVPLFERLFEISRQNLYGEDGKVEQDSMALMVDYYMDKASSLYREQNYAAAYNFLVKILKAKPGFQKAASMKMEIEDKGQELYNKGYIEQTQYNDCKQAIFYFRQVIQMVPKTDPLYKKALKRISDCEQ